jgi:hypothetical protein
MGQMDDAAHGPELDRDERLQVAQRIVRAMFAVGYDCDLGGVPDLVGQRNAVVNERLGSRRVCPPE